MYFYFIWKHCHSKVVIFPMPHEQKDKEKKKNCVKTVKDYLFMTIIIFLHLNYIWWHLYAMQNQDYILVNI